MKTILLFAALVLLPFISIGQSTIIWTGANNSDWHDAGNWNTGVLPDSTDQIIIPNTAVNMPTLFDTSYVAGLMIQSSAQFTIDTHAYLVINSIAGDALLSRGIFNNHGTLDISAIDRGIGPTAGVGEINNYGKIQISAKNQEAVRYHDIYNYHLATIQSSSELSDAIVITNSMLNYGNIIVDSAALFGLKTFGEDFRNTCSAVISIQHCHGGIFATGNFINLSRIKISDVSIGILHETIGGSGTFKNADDRLLYLSEISDTVIQARRFENFGYLEIHGGQTDVGIQVDQSSEFNNVSGGQINLYGNFNSSLSVDSGGVFLAQQYSERDFDATKLDWNFKRNEYYRPIDGELRNFLIHVPEIYDSTSSVPLLFMLHGGSGDGTKFYNISGWKEKANVDNFISVYPSALKYLLAEHLECTTRWSDDKLVDRTLPGTPIKDDILFMRELISLCQNTFNIDTSRIYFCGFSNGSGFVRERVLPEMTDVVAATAGTGSFGHNAIEYPIDSIYFPHWDLFGTHDPKLLQGPGLSEFPIQGDSLLAIPEVLVRVENITSSLQVDMSFTEHPQPPLYNTLEFTNDLSGQGNEYKLTIVKNLEHQFANGTNHPLVYADILWPWFMEWQR